MKQSKQFLENAENCAQLAERASDEPTRNRCRRMEAAWRALAEEQDWLDGEVPPVSLPTTANSMVTHERRRLHRRCTIW